jgi:putative PIN family toxin of toxin-antitoxin system
MNVVLDTNVLVSGLLSPFAPPGEVVRLVVAGRLTPCLDARLMAEYAAVLHRPKFGFAPDSVAALLNYLLRTGLFMAAETLARPLPDPDDQPFLEVALAGRAECLITGNRRHYPAASCEGQRVLAPAEFIRHYQQQLRSTHAR